MRDLKHTLADLAERGTPIGADRLRDRVMLEVNVGAADLERLATQRLGLVEATAVGEHETQVVGHQRHLQVPISVGLALCRQHLP